MFFKKKKKIHSCKLCGVEIKAKEVVCHRPECFKSVIYEYNYFLTDTECSLASNFSFDYQEKISEIYESILENDKSFPNYRVFEILGISLGGHNDRIDLDTRISFMHKISTKGVVINIPCTMHCVTSVSFHEDLDITRIPEPNCPPSRTTPKPCRGELFLCGVTNEKNEIRLSRAQLSMNLRSPISQKDKIINKLEKCMSKDVDQSLTVKFYSLNKIENFTLLRDRRYIENWWIEMNFAKENYQQYWGIDFINQNITVDCQTVQEGTKL